jgi:hypothetical protein
MSLPVNNNPSVKTNTEENKPQSIPEQSHIPGLVVKVLSNSSSAFGSPSRKRKEGESQISEGLSPLIPRTRALSMESLKTPKLQRREGSFTPIAMPQPQRPVNPVAKFILDQDEANKLAFSIDNILGITPETEVTEEPKTPPKKEE